MQPLYPAIRHYPWGSTTLIPELAGQPVTGEHVAELWFGAHPAAPAHLAAPEGGTTSLDQVIAVDPEYQLGARVEQSADSRLPFMLKLLAADEPLSLQAHPSKAAAEEGFARENAAGLALDDPQRNYKDANHKPELIVALTPFRALAGFRSIADTQRLFDALDCAQLQPYAQMLAVDDTESARLHKLFRRWVTLDDDERAALITEIVDKSQALIAGATGLPAWMLDSLHTVVDLQRRYPGDIGVLGALLLHHVSLDPGQALCLEAGQLHAYLAGMGVEIMANSDNVLRGGLTAKHVDVPELLSVLEFSSVANPVVHAEQTQPGRYRYPSHAAEFVLERVELDSAQPQVRISHDGPVVVLVTRGQVQASAGSAQMLAATEAVWLPAGDGPCEFSLAANVGVGAGRGAVGTGAGRGAADTGAGAGVSADNSAPHAAGTAELFIARA